MQFVTDFLTGERIEPNVPLVAFLVAGALPDGPAWQNPTMQLASLPLTGVLTPEGGVAWHAPNSLAMRMALSMTHSASPLDLSEATLGRQARAQLLGKANHPPGMGFSGKFERTYSLAIVRADVYENLVTLQGGAFTDVRVAEVVALLEEGEAAIERARDGGGLHDDTVRQQLFSLGEACALRCAGTYLDDKSHQVPAPELCTALSEKVFADDLVETAQAFGMLSLLYRDPRGPEDGDGGYGAWAGLKEYLAGLWQARCFSRALQMLGGSVRPSAGDLLQDSARAHALMHAFLPVLVRAAQCLRVTASTKEERKDRAAQLRSLNNAQRYLLGA